MKKLIKGHDWCVTGINKLTKIREVITVPLSKDLAEQCRKSLADKKPKDREYLRPLVEKRINYPPPLQQ